MVCTTRLSGGRCGRTPSSTSCAACADLTAAGQPVTFGQVAAHAGISRTTLCRRADLRAVVDEHRARGREATTLTGLIIQIDQLRHSLEAVADRVRHHEEQLRRLERAGREGTK